MKTITNADERIVCKHCERLLEIGDNYITHDGDHYCEDCFDDLLTFCDNCGCVEFRDDMVYYEAREEYYCPDCADDLLRTCSDCGELVHRNSTYGTANGSVCRWCYEDHYITCADCGEVIHIDDSRYDDEDEEYYCEDCYHDHQNKAIHDYYYKPAPIFRGTAPRFLGVELEIDEAGEDNDNARRLLDIAGDDIYCKHDGSLNEGFEIVSQPCSLDYHLHTLPWDEILHEAVGMGYRSHDAGSCGLHVHVSRLAFGDTYEAQEEAIARVLYFAERNWEQLLRFSRRTQYQLDRWARRYEARADETPADLLHKAKNTCDRYRAINLTPSHTIEFRLFRGTLNETTFYATLELVDALCEYCINTTDSKALNWHSFRQTVTRFEMLCEYLQKRGI
jgi:hypothetical protein